MTSSKTKGPPFFATVLKCVYRESVTALGIRFGQRESNRFESEQYVREMPYAERSSTRHQLTHSYLVETLS